MPDEYNKTTEPEFSEIVLQLLAEAPNGRLTFAQLIRQIPSRIRLTEADLAQSQTRPAEAVWEQRVRNIKSHKTAFGNIIGEGYVTEIASGLEITAAGRHRVGRG